MMVIPEAGIVSTKFDIDLRFYVYIIILVTCPSLSGGGNSDDINFKTTTDEANQSINHKMKSTFKSIIYQIQ